MSISGLFDAIGLFADEEFVGTWEDKFVAVDFEWATLLSSPFCSCILFAIVLGQLNKWWRFSHSSRVKFPLVSNVCGLMFDINVSNLNLRIKINPIKQPIQSNSVGSWYVSHRGTSSFNYHLNHGFIVIKDIQHSIGTIMCSAWWNVIYIGQIEIGVRSWNLLSHVADVALLHLWFRWFGLVRDDILQLLNPEDQVLEFHPCVNLHRDNFSFCRTVRNWSLFLAHPTYWHKCSAFENAQHSSWCWLRVFKVSCEIRVLKQFWSALLCCVSHLTMLPVFTCVMHVRDQTRQTFVTRFCPFRHRTSKFVHRP